MSNGYKNTLDNLSDRICRLSKETQEKYFLEKFDILLNSIKEKIETYNESKILTEIYEALNNEYKRFIEKGMDQFSENLLYDISSDLEVEFKKLNN